MFTTDALIAIYGYVSDRKIRSDVQGMLVGATGEGMSFRRRVLVFKYCLSVAGPKAKQAAVLAR